MRKPLTLDTAFSRYFKIYRIFFYLLNRLKPKPDPNDKKKPSRRNNVLAETIILSEAWSWLETTESGEFYKSESQWLNEFGINRSQLRDAKIHLKELRFLDFCRKKEQKNRGPFWYQANKTEVLESIRTYMRINPKFLERKFQSDDDEMPKLDNVAEFPSKKEIAGKPIKRRKC